MFMVVELDVENRHFFNIKGRVTIRRVWNAAIFNIIALISMMTRDSNRQTHTV